jgi:hypothetical protein
MSKNNPVLSEALSETLSDIDRMALELEKLRRQSALSEAGKAVAQSQVADLTYKYFVLQLFMKYNLSSNDTISEDGKIIRGGAKKES